MRLSYVRQGKHQPAEATMSAATSIDIREMQAADYDAVLDLWRSTPGVTVRDADAFTPQMVYLKKNPGLSFVAADGKAIVGAVLCGTDGRRGYLQHLAVHPGYRRQGLGRALAERCVNGLADAGIDKCHLMVVTDNHEAAAFWQHIGWEMRSDVRLMSHTRSGVATA
jgi:ribosomal protein S18 acetylase RimI-like enzyme